jgi:UDP-N-acetyl-D-mannosaminuronate dehydrogenase
MEKKKEELPMKDKTVCIVGLGYVGLPLAEAFVMENKSVKWVMSEE